MDEQNPSDVSTSRVVDSKVELERQYSVFALLLAMGSILTGWHRLEYANGDSVLLTICLLTVVFGLIVLIKRRWTLALFFLGAIHLSYGLISLPRVAAADLFWMFFGATICVSHATGWIANRSHQVSGVRLYRSVAPCLRMITILAILSMSVARLNWNFVDIEASSVSYDLAILFGGQSAPHWLVYTVMSLLVVVDLFLSFALMVPGLRRFAVGFGSCYFSWQATMGIGESVTMLPVIILGFYLFMSSELVARICARVQRLIPLPAIRLQGLSIATLAVAVVAIALWWQNKEMSTGQIHWSSRNLVNWYFVTMISVWVVVLLTSMIDQRSRLTWVSMMLRNPLHYVILAILSLVIAAPYIGFGGIGRFEGSGLSTVGGRSNHLLIPQTQIADYETDLIEIINSTDPYLQNIADEGMLVTWFEFVNYVAVRPETRVRFSRGGDRFQVKRTGDIQELSQSNHWLLRKTLTFDLVKSDDGLAAIGNGGAKRSEHDENTES